MSSVTTSIRLDKDLKERASKLAKEMGLSLSQVAENYFRQFLRDEEIVFDISPAERLVEGSVRKDIKNMRAESNHREQIFGDIEKNKQLRDEYFSKQLSGGL